MLRTCGQRYAAARFRLPRATVPEAATTRAFDHDTGGLIGALAAELESWPRGEDRTVSWLIAYRSIA